MAYSGYVSLHVNWLIFYLIKLHSMSYRIEQILTEDILDQAVAFRSSALRCLEQVPAARLNSDICSSDTALPVGLVGRVNGQIVGVLFFVCQGRDNHGQGSLIVNLSDFVVDSEHRGILPFVMIKKAVHILNETVITGFTPNADMQKICTLLKFKYQAMSWCCVPPIHFGNLLAGHIISRIVPSSTPARIGGMEFLPRKAPDMEVYQIEDNDANVVRSWGVTRIHKRRILGITLRFRCHWVWAVDGEGDQRRAASSLSWHLLFRRGIFVTVFARSNNEKWPLTWRFPTIWMVRGVGGSCVEFIYPPFSSEVFL